MRNLIILFMVMSMARAQDNISTAYRLHYERSDGKDEIEGNGTAFAVDLSEWGLEGPHYLMTAAHNLYDDNGHQHDKIEIELRPKKWVECRIMHADVNLDIAVIKCDKELTKLASIAVADAQPKDKVTLYGSPSGVPVKACEGVVIKRFDTGKVTTRVELEFDRGDSGGPLYDKADHVVGMAINGVLTEKREFNHKVGLFLPTCALRAFLDTFR